jgi:glycerophosphoryl diester phosphodiesterase
VINTRRSKPGRAGTLVIGHRGASGYRPEHTLASYELAARLGADFIEPDLVITKDGVLVARHEPEIGGTTDVASHPEFASRRVTKVLDGISVTGWWAEDFTLAELNTLRAVERLPAIRQENTLYDGRFAIPTLQQVLDLRKDLSRRLGREIGVYPETKHPTYFQKAGLALEARLLGALRRNGLNHGDSPVIVQSFETKNLQQLRDIGLRTRVVQLLGASGAPYDLVSSGDPRRRRYRPGQEPSDPAPCGRHVGQPDGAGGGRPQGRTCGAPVHLPSGEHVPAGGSAPRYNGLRLRQGHR